MNVDSIEQTKMKMVEKCYNKKTNCCSIKKKRIKFIFVFWDDSLNADSFNSIVLFWGLINGIAKM